MEKMIKKAHDAITRIKGKEYAPTSTEIQDYINKQITMEQQTIKMCTGCGRLNTQPLGLNKNGEPYLACCPDNNYKEITSVEWLFIMLKDGSKELFDGNIWEQAKQIEKDQLFEFWNGGINSTDEGGKSFDQFYEIYNK